MIITELSSSIDPTELFASVSADGGTAVVMLQGEADLFTLPELVDVLSRAIADFDGPVVVDLSRTTFLDTGTVRAFARARRFLAERGRTLTVRSPSPMAMRLLGMLGATSLIELPPVVLTNGAAPGGGRRS
jgi:anti-anti-sigma factor